MKRVRLIHWNTVEGQAKARFLAAAGFQVNFQLLDGSALLKVIRGDPLDDVVVIDLTRRPSHGREIAHYIRKRPVLFVNLGAGGQLDGLPAAACTTWDQIASRLLLPVPILPRPQANSTPYSQTPLVVKLGIKPGMRIVVRGAPPEFEELLGDLPEGAGIVTSGRASLTFWFVRSQAELDREIAFLTASPVWIVWPKKTAKVPANLTQLSVRRQANLMGYVDYKMASIDETWTAMLFKLRERGT